jgi:peptidyl-dipeptidase Dcp
MNARRLLAGLGVAAVLACVATEAADTMTKAAGAPVNPLLAPWRGPYGGVPPFDVVKPAQLAPALEAGMAQQLAEIEQIAADPQPATFDNTIAALERSGRTLDRVTTVYGIYTSTMSGDEVQTVEREMSPKLAAFSDQITQNDSRGSRRCTTRARPRDSRPSSSG